MTVRPYLQMLAVIDLPEPVIERAEVAAPVPDGFVATESFFMGANPVTGRPELKPHTRKRIPKNLQPPRRVVEQLLAGPHPSGLMLALVTDVGWAVPELDAGDLVLYRQMLGGMFSAGAPDVVVDGEKLIHMAQVYAAGRERPGDR